MKHEYEDIMSMLTLLETIAQSLLLLPGVLLHLGNNIGIVRLSLKVSAWSQCHASYFIPILSPFLFMPSLYALLFLIHSIFYLLVLSTTILSDRDGHGT